MIHIWKHIVTHMTISGERLSKRISEFTLSTIERQPLLGNAKKHAFFIIGVFCGVRTEEL
jgi:hypothetical protein